MSVLVTGGAGFLGAHLVRALVADGRSVVALDDLSGGLRENVPAGVPLVVGSVCDAELVGRLFADHRFDTVFHLAAYAAEGLSHFIRRFNYTNNVVGSVTLINEAVRHRVRRFVFTSSMAVYGVGELPLRETHVPRPEDPYGIAKLAVELDLAAAHHQFGLEHTIFRPHNLYGPFQSMRDRYRNVVSIFLNQALRGEPLTIFGDGKQTRAFTYVEDVVGAIARSAWMDTTRNQIFNVGGDHPYEILELAETVLRVTGTAGPIRHVEARNEVVHAWSDHTRFEEVFGCGVGVGAGSTTQTTSPAPQIPPRQTSLLEGVTRTWEWARGLGPSPTPPFSDIELDVGLPDVWRR